MTEPRVSVVVPALNSAATLGRTLAALAAQELDGEWETIVVDDGSSDETPAVARAAPGRVTVLEGERCGAATARNLGVAAAAAPVIAFTDADCFPAPDWLARGLAAIAGADLVQGRVIPDETTSRGPYDRTIWVQDERGFYETANLFVTRELFERIGGFEDWLDVGGAKLMAEDVWFGWRAVRAGARTTFARDALVHHAVFPRGPVGFIGERLRLRYFPAIARKIPEFRDRPLFARVFLSRRSAELDLGIAGAALAIGTRRPAFLLAALPYARTAAGEARPFRRRAPLVAGVRIAADLVGAAALIAGSVRYRSPVL